MSMPFSIIRCEQCSQKWASHSAYGGFLYELPDGRRAWAKRTLAWCEGCQGFAPVEMLPEPQELEEELSTMTAKLEEASILVEKRIFGFLKVMKPANEDAVDTYTKCVVEAQAAIDWRKLRKSKPRCLSCGSQDVYQESVWDSNKIHPGCGGKLIIEDSGYRISLHHTDRIYDVDGNFLREEEEVRIKRRR